MIINITSNQINKPVIRGPKKVLNNLTKGLDLTNIKYVYNQPLNNYQYNWIQDSNSALIEASFLKIPVLLGPNMAIAPGALPYLRPSLNKDSIYLQPSNWAKKFWLAEGFKECKVEEWPVGIDTNLFNNIDRSNLAPKVLVYFKNRDEQELYKCLDVLKRCRINYCVLKYGSYNETQFIESLTNSTFCIWIGCDESQGIALQEVLSTNMPIIVIKDFKSKFKFFGSSPAPYFNNSCGLLLDDFSELSEDLIKNFSPKDFAPRKYIVNTLSLSVSATIFVDKIKRIKTNKTNRLNIKVGFFLIYLIELPFRKTTYKILLNKFFK